MRPLRSEFYVTVARWVDWASTVVEQWPDDVSDAPFDAAAAEEAVALVESIDTILSTNAEQP